MGKLSIIDEFRKFPDYKKGFELLINLFDIIPENEKVEKLGL